MNAIALESATPLADCSVSYGGSASIIDFPRPIWREAVEEQLRYVLKLEEGWDGFEAGPIRRDVVTYAYQLLDSIMKRKSPAPHITPMSNQGLLLEWHLEDIDLEIEIEAANNAWVSFENRRGDIDVEWSVDVDLRTLATPIDVLTEAHWEQAEA